MSAERHLVEARPRPRAKPGPLQVLALPGSLRRDSYNRRLLVAARRHAPRGMRVTVYDDLGAVPLFSEDVDEATGGGPEGVRRLRDAIESCDGLLIATPEYNQSIPGVLKNAIDWLSLNRPRPVLQSKPVAVMGATTGAWGTRLAQRTLREALFATESSVLPGPAIYVRHAEEAFDPGGALTDPEMPRRLGDFLRAFAEWIRLTARRRRE